MTREEEIDAMARRYTDSLPAEIDRFCKESMYSAYVVGAMWADEHPKNVWHDANEKPNCGSDVIALDCDNVLVYGTFKDDDDYDECIYRHNGFRYEIFEYEYVTKWAYIKDLLPKGCEK